MNSTQALLIVDVQNDFCPGGALAVPRGDEVVEVLNQYAVRFHAQGLPVFASRDWHPAKSRHFTTFGGPWPIHCVEGTPGAAFHPGLHLPPGTVILSKGTALNKDGYSAFEGEDKDGRRLEDLLKENNVEEIFVGGLATDYCVKASVLDARKKGFRVRLLVDAIRGVNIESEDEQKALKEMYHSGAKDCHLKDLYDKQ